MNFDTVIVGGGASGGFCAWRIQTESPGERVGLFEFGDRIGGRLFSVALPGLANVYAELGGMRFIPSEHVRVAAVVKALGLQTKAFPMGAPAPVGASENLLYLRGRHFRVKDFGDPSLVPYSLSASERGLGPEELQDRVAKTICPGLNALSLPEQMEVMAFGKPLFEHGFWDLMYRSLSNEGYQFMKDAGGYDANVANANAATQLPATEYKDTTEFLTLRDGYDQIPKTLVKDFDAAPGDAVPAGQRVHMNRRLVEIQPLRDAPDGFRYSLLFQPTVTVDGKTRDAPEDVVEVRARRIILAMPRRSLELINGPFFENESFKADLKSVLEQHAFKLFLAYDQPWWRGLGLVAGRSVTDLPVRQMFYFGTEGEQEGAVDKSSTNSLLMASYNDISTVPFWKGLEAGAPFVGRPPAGPGPASTQPATPFKATQDMVEIANRQVAEVHALPEIPIPYAAAYHDWSDDPYGGGWHEWKAGYRVNEVIDRMIHPVAGEDIFIVGSAYSYDQAWVEGALATSEAMLEKFFGIKPIGSPQVTVKDAGEERHEEAWQ